MGDDDHRNFVGARRVSDVDEDRSRREAFARRLTGPPSSAPRARSSVPPMMPSRPPTRSTLPAPPSIPPLDAIDPIDPIDAIEAIEAIDATAADHLTAARAAARLHDLPLAAHHYRAAREATEDEDVHAEVDRFRRACVADECILQGRAEERNHHWAAAAAHFARAFEARHDAASAAHAAADLRRAKLDLHEAARFAEYAVSKAPGRADFHLVLGLVYREAGLMVRACSEFERALQIDPGNEHALKFLNLPATSGRKP